MRGGEGSGQWRGREGPWQTRWIVSALASDRHATLSLASALSIGYGDDKPLHSRQTAGTNLKPDGAPLTIAVHQDLPIRALLRSFCFMDTALLITAEPMAATSCLSLPADGAGYTTYPTLVPLPLNREQHTSRTSMSVVATKTLLHRIAYAFRR